MKIEPPKLAQKLFDWYAGFAKVDDLRGDMDEWFYHNAKTKSISIARRIYWKQVLSLIFSYALRKRKRNSQSGIYSSNAISLSMIRNYIKVAMRNLYQYRYFTLLNAFGLAIGMSISLLLISMYGYISTSDNFHTNGDHIYTIISKKTEGFEEGNFASSPIVLAEKLKEEFNDAREVVRVNASFEGEVVREKENIHIHGYFVDQSFLSVFTFPILSGNMESALSKPNTVVLTESAAIKFFGSIDVVGKVIELKEQGSYEITGVLKDYSKNTHFKFEALVSYATLPPTQSLSIDQWTEYRDQFIYVLLKDSAPIKGLQSYLSQIEKNIYSNSSVKVNFSLLALDEIITSDLYNALGPKWETSGFIVFGAIALLILLPACFNYTNISIARALKRSKEIGLRKTMGGVKSQIFFQFITETVVICLISLVGACGLFLLMRDEFQSMLVEASVLDLSITLKTATLFVAFALLTGLMAGLFPAMYFAGLNPIEALKNKVSSRALSGMRIRKGLTIFQFALSFCFILSLIVFGRQYRTLLNFDFGFQKENIVNVNLQEVKPELLKTELEKLSVVQSVSLSSGSPGLSNSTTWVNTTDKDSVQVSQLFIDSDFLENFKLKLILGKNFPEAVSADERYCIVNEQFLINNKIALEDGVGRTLLVDSMEIQIIGVVKNFHYAPPQIPIGNFIFRNNPVYYTQANVLVDVSDVFGTFTMLENSWQKLSDNTKLEAAFFKDELNDSYQVYRLLLKMAGFLGLLAISISILGLLGMVVYTAENRVKEVSIRKVLGASAFGITMLLSRDYLKLIIWSIAIGIPLAIGIYETVFTRIPDYHANLTVLDVVLGAFGLISLGLITIASQTYKTALSNPADTLKTE
ncbi:ABC transporter permease [Chryseotalea sanaruensis]|uniref:ABC transporter permease n=1 Tax=Chryseotalea sanaruensis TaxID=2482724 RepID=A0A401U809_9BACT|nr:ABC transporter permease [Chryseotalea sanaruensis]GCC51022.1 ABC transporter permease [Chryseotalea sanaruensis]